MVIKSTIKHGGKKGKQRTSDDLDPVGTRALGQLITFRLMPVVGQYQFTLVG